MLEASFIIAAQVHREDDTRYVFELLDPFCSSRKLVRDLKKMNGEMAISDSMFLDSCFSHLCSDNISC
jgi:hypothetical protein